MSALLKHIDCAAWDDFKWDAGLPPDITDRQFWQSVDGDVRAKCIRGADSVAGRQWPALPASTYMQFIECGDRANYEKLYLDRRRALSLLLCAELLEDQGRYMQDIIDLVWCICEESSWVLPAHNRLEINGKHSSLPDAEHPDYDLFAAETGAQISLARYFLKARLDERTPIIAIRMVSEVVKRVIEPHLTITHHGWQGYVSKTVNNWNPWIHSNVLLAVCALPLEQEVRVKAVKKAMYGVDVFIDGYAEDGACDEGPSYWCVAGGCMFDFLHILRAVSQGEIDIFGDTRIRNMVEYIVNAHMGGEHYLPFADSHNKTTVPQNLLYRYGKADVLQNSLGEFWGAGVSNNHMSKTEGFARSLITDRPQIVSFAAMLCRKWMRTMDSNPCALSGYLWRYMQDVLTASAVGSADGGSAMPRDYWAPSLQVMIARTCQGSSDGLTLAAKGGTNDESHNHNDIGSFALYLDGQPVVIDVGVGTYTRDTFTHKRYTIWSMQSQYHNLPSPDGQLQIPGPAAAAKNAFYTAAGTTTEMGIDIEDAYPPECGLAQWTRRFSFDRTSDCVTVCDRYRFDRAGRSVSFNFMCCNKPETDSGVIRFFNDLGGVVSMTFDAEAISAEVETIMLNDDLLVRDWDRERLYRVILRRTVPAGAAGEETFIFTKG